MLIAVPAETDPGKGRVAATPETVKKFIGLGAKVVVQSGAGLASGILDADSGCGHRRHHLHRLGHRLPQARRADERQADHAPWGTLTSYSLPANWRTRIRLTNHDRGFFIQLYRWFPSILSVLTIVQPETLVRWHRGRISLLVWHASSSRRPAPRPDLRGPGIASDKMP
jgi:hypothetical protein